MPRQARESSGTGIYHVMMRGINHQNIFEEQEDYYQFLNTLDMMAQSYEPDGTPSGRNYILYAYCLMSNHIHLLIRELMKQEPVPVVLLAYGGGAGAKRHL